MRRGGKAKPRVPRATTTERRCAGCRQMRMETDLTICDDCAAVICLACVDGHVCAAQENKTGRQRINK